MEPEIRALNRSTIAMVFTNLIKLTDFLGTKPDFFHWLQSGIWSDIKKPEPKVSDECWLLMKKGDFGRVQHLLQ